MPRTTTASAALALVLALTLAGCASDDSGDAAEGAAPASASAMQEDPAASASAMQEDEAAESEDAAMAEEGAWIDQATYDADPASYHAAGDVVLFFNASWCPTCQATVKSLDADGTPAGLTVVSVDYDSSAELKRKYGVTVQHTFVQVDGSGNELMTFTGSRTGEDIAARTV